MKYIVTALFALLVSATSFAISTDPLTVFNDSKHFALKGELDLVKTTQLLALHGLVPALDENGAPYGIVSANRYHSVSPLPMNYSEVFFAIMAVDSSGRQGPFWVVDFYNNPLATLMGVLQLKLNSHNAFINTNFNSSASIYSASAKNLLLHTFFKMKLGANGGTFTSHVETYDVSLNNGYVFPSMIGAITFSIHSSGTQKERDYNALTDEFYVDPSSALGGALVNLGFTPKRWWVQDNFDGTIFKP